MYLGKREEYNTGRMRENQNPDLQTIREQRGNENR